MNTFLEESLRELEMAIESDLDIEMTPEEVDMAFEAFLNDEDTIEDEDDPDDMITSLEALLSDYDIAFEGDDEDCCGDEECDDEECAKKGKKTKKAKKAEDEEEEEDEEPAEESEGAKKDNLFKRMFEAIKKFFTVTIPAKFAEIKKSFNDHIGKFLKEKFFINPKKWAIWGKIAGKFKKYTSDVETEGKKLTMESLDEKKPSIMGKVRGTITSITEAFKSLIGKDVAEMDKIESNPEDNKKVDGSVIGKAIAMIFGVLSAPFKAIKAIYEKVKSWLTKKQKESTVVEPSTDAEDAPKKTIGQAITGLCSAIGEMLRAIASGAYAVISYIPRTIAGKISDKKKGAANESVTFDIEMMSNVAFSGFYSVCGIDL